jgi:hypothetical protein
MSLFFLQPIYLYGLIAAAVPLIIHLLNRRRLKRIRFPAVRFILLSQRRISRSYRLRHWLVLALRTLAVVLLVLLLAHPVFQTGMGVLAGSGAASVVVVLDNSLSMTWSRDGEGFEQAKAAAKRLLASLKAGDRAGVIATTGGEGGGRLNSERQQLSRDLDAVRLGAGSPDFARALRQAYALLSQPAGQKEIWLFTDLNLTGWEHFRLSQLERYDPLVPLKIVRVGEDSRLPNAAIKELNVEGQGIGVGLPVQLSAHIVNFGDEEIKDVAVVLSLDGKEREQKVVALPPHGEATVSFQFGPERPGAFFGRIELKKRNLEGNSIGHFTIQAEDRLKVLVVDGDARTSLVQSESFFLTRALNPSAGSEASLFLPTVVIPEGLTSVNLDPYQVVIFCNVASIPDGLLARVRDFVMRGGGILFFVGDRVQAEDYNRKLFQTRPAILPALIKEKKMAPASPGETIDKLDAGHPALHGLKDRLLQDSLRTTRVQGYLSTEPNGSPVLLGLSNGDPILVERKIGAGRVLFFATAADRDWSDLPLKTAYLPLVHSLVSYLAGGARGSADTGLTVGSAKSFSFPVSFAGRKLRIIRPDGTERELTLQADADKAVAVFTENDLAGTYRLSLQGGLTEKLSIAQAYAANPPFLESRLKSIDGKELKAKLGSIRAEVIALTDLDDGGRSWDLSLPLLLLTLATLATEGWLSQKSHE